MTFEEQEALERLKATLQRELEERKIAATSAQEERRREIGEVAAMAATAATFANEAMRGLLLVNGGAVVAILTFVGNMRRLEHATNAAVFGAAISQAVTAFIVGLIAALFAFGVSYLSQTVLRESPKQVQVWIGGGLRAVAFLAAFASLAAFARGALAAASALQVVSILSCRKATWRCIGAGADTRDVSSASGSTGRSHRSRCARLACTSAGRVNDSACSTFRQPGASRGATFATDLSQPWTGLPQRKLDPGCYRCSSRSSRKLSPR